ncbi:MAG: YidC/Oxa1 family membrane protein insertase [Firmicutes bacterium]|nr:YidC/Oxa1 family membrane protein insertase [Bacillota bacterium]
MKKNKKLLIVVISLVFLLTGCTKQFKDVDGKLVQDETTKQTLVENILCRPVELKDTYEEAIKEKKKDLKEKYDEGDLSKKEYNKKLDELLDLEELPVCTKMSITEGGYESIWTSIFVKPLAWVIVQIGKIVGNYGLAIILVTILIKLILFPITYKSLKQSESIRKAQPKLNKIEKKYAGKTDQESMMMKSNEMMAVYKEFKINPMSGCLMSFLQIPLFFAFYEALYRLPLLFEGKFLGLHMGITPIAAAQQGEWYYLVLPVIVGLVTYFSFTMNKNQQSGEQMKQMNMMFNIMVVMIFITSFSMSTAIIIYWVVNSILGIGQNLIVKKGSK